MGPEYLHNSVCPVFFTMFVLVELHLETDPMPLSPVVVQTGVQGPRPLRYRLHSEAVAAPVRSRERCVCTSLQQEHHRNLPELVSMPI